MRFDYRMGVARPGSYPFAAVVPPGDVKALARMPLLGKCRSCAVFSPHCLQQTCALKGTVEADDLSLTAGNKEQVKRGGKKA
jgi:hypothetical protein